VPCWIGRKSKLAPDSNFEFPISLQLQYATLYHCSCQALNIAQRLNPQINSRMNNCDAASRRTGFRFSEIPEARADPVVGALVVGALWTDGNADSPAPLPLKEFVAGGVVSQKVCGLSQPRTPVRQARFHFPQGG